MSISDGPEVVGYVILADEIRQPADDLDFLPHRGEEIAAGDPVKEVIAFVSLGVPGTSCQSRSQLLVYES